MSQRSASLAVLGFACCVVLCAVSTTLAKKDTTRNGQQYEWAAGVTIQVYIRKDPDPTGDRNPEVEAGIKEWEQRLKDRGINISIHKDAAPPDGATNVVNVYWVPNGKTVQGSGKVIGSGAGRVPAMGGYIPGKSGGMNGGYILLGQDVLNKGLDEVKNFAEHEFGHTLGLADDDTGVVMDPDQPSTARGSAGNIWNEEDTKELNSIYNLPPPVEPPQAEASKLDGGAEEEFVRYGFEFVSGGGEPGTEHIGMIVVGIPASHVADVSMTDFPGWLALVPDGPVPASDPYFSWDGYATDCVSLPIPWAPNIPPYFVSLRESDTEAAADGLPPTLDAALSDDTPSAALTLQLKPGLADCSIQIWAGGDVQVVPGPFRIQPVEQVAFEADTSTLSWEENFGSDRYDVVRGDLKVLRQSSGDYALALNGCLVQDGTDTRAADGQTPQPPGSGFFYLVRGQGCGPDGSYDSRGLRQTGPRDTGIQASPQRCN